MNIISILFIIIGMVSLSGGVFLYFRNKKTILEHDRENERKMYELAILKEIGDRTGYSLNVQNIVDIITGSLHQFMEYSAVSYMLIKPEKIIFKVHLEKSVSRKFINEVQDRMIKSISALANKEFKKDQIEELISGAILVDEVNEPVNSFFNIPLVIGEKVVGVLTVADVKSGLYKEEETTILYKLTGQASLAVTRLQEVIENEQKKLNSMVQSMNEGVVMTDKDYQIMVVNPAARRAIGVNDEKELTIFDFIDNLDGKFDIRGKLEESVKLNKVLISKDVLIGDRFYQIFVSPVKSDLGLDKGEVLGGVVIFHDITKEIEINKIKEDFISMMVHELRSPLNGIYMISQLMEKAEKIKDIKQYKKNVNLVKNSTESMLNIVNDLLDSAKIESGKFEIHLAPADLKQIIKDKINFFTAQAKSNNLKLDFQIDKDLTESAIIDEERIKQVMNNLISNALKFTSSGGQIYVQAFMHKKGNSIIDEVDKAGIKMMIRKEDKIFDTDENSVIFAITDSGQGISKENISNLFNKFVQFQASSQTKGTGLGLVISKGIIEAHHGEIKVFSELGIGTTFLCKIPV